MDEWINTSVLCCNLLFISYILQSGCPKYGVWRLKYEENGEEQKGSEVGCNGWGTDCNAFVNIGRIAQYLYQLFVH